VEVPLATVAALGAKRPAGLEIEMFAYGRLPLAFSARCFTARSLNRPKDDCGFVCGDHPDGITLFSRDDQPFLTLNGIQTQSAAVQNLLPHVEALRSAGIDLLRLSPHSRDFPAVIRAFRAAADATGETATCPAPSLPGGYCDGYLRGEAGIGHAG
jgi:collagenase-like PrtC family protease